jgi:hypothetical protein
VHAPKAQQALEIEVRMLREVNKIYYDAIATIASHPTHFALSTDAVTLKQVAQQAIIDAAKLPARLER